MSEEDSWAEQDAYVDDLDRLKREADQLRHALETRTVIGQAEGIIMERLNLDADRAFQFLKRLSSTSNRKIVEIAGEIAETRRLPRAD